jgi:hypothetical protein
VTGKGGGGKNWVHWKYFEKEKENLIFLPVNLK